MVAFVKLTAIYEYNQCSGSLTLYDPGRLLKPTPPPLRSFALTHLILKLRSCALGTFPKKKNSFTPYSKINFDWESRFSCKGGFEI